MSERRILATWIGLVVGSWLAVGLALWGLMRVVRWVALLGLVLVAVPAQAQEVPSSVRVAQGVFVAAQVADWASTKWAISRGAVEINPLMQGSDTKRAVLKAGMTVAVLWVTQQMGKERPKLAKGLLYVLSGVTFGVSANNIRVGFSVGVPRD